MKAKNYWSSLKKKKNTFKALSHNLKFFEFFFVIQLVFCAAIGLLNLIKIKSVLYDEQLDTKNYFTKTLHNWSYS